MRLLQAMRGRRSALVSVVGHAVFIGVLVLIGTHTQTPSFESPLIVAELITATLEPSPTATVDTIPEAPEAPAEESAPAPQPRVAELDPATPAPAPPAPPEAEPEPTTEPPAESPTVEQLADLEEPTTEPAAEPPAPASPSEVAEPPTAEAVAESVADGTPHRSFATYEEESVRRKLASWTGRFETDKGEPTLTWRDDGQQYTAVLKRSSAADATGMERLVVELTTQRDGERLATELRMTRLAFSNFGQFVNRWDPEVGLNDDVIDGRFHSNTGVTINRTGRATPIFGGKVTIAGGEVVTMAEGFLSTHPARLNKRKLFPAGIETHARRIELPERATALDAVSGPDNSQRFARDAALTFHDDGSVSWRELEGERAEARRALGGEPFYLLADDDDVELEVSGTVNGKVLVYTPGRIVVTGDLRYAADPDTPQADDYLGLVAERTVEIAEPDVTGSGDLEIFASIYARQRFVVRDYTSRRSGTLIVHGSLTAGTLSASEPRFATRIEFDDRLTSMRAPGFPLSDRYELDSSSGEWRVVDTP
jgi:hypothetical protein